MPFSKRFAPLLAVTVISVLIVIGVYNNPGKHVVTGFNKIILELPLAINNGHKSERNKLDPFSPAPRNNGERTNKVHRHTLPHQLHVVTVACAGRTEEGLVLLKSIAMLTISSPLMLHIFTENTHHGYFLQELATWPREVQDRVTYRLYNITEPNDPDAKGWKSPFWKPCSNHRLFLHSFLPDVDSVLYLDSDALMLSAVDEMWKVFAHFNGSQLVAMGRESESRNGGWYKRHSKVPYVAPSALNSGVILMNLTRIRRSDWTKRIVEYSQTYRKKLKWIDQDLINIYLHFHPDKLYLLDCSWNYRTDHCMGRYNDRSSVCRLAENSGAYILHGSRQALRNPRTGLKPIYEAFKKFSVAGGNLTHMLEDMQNGLKQKKLPCTTVTTVYFKRLTKAVEDARNSTTKDMSHG